MLVVLVSFLIVVGPITELVRRVGGGQTGVVGRGLRVEVKVVQVMVEKLPQVSVLDEDAVPWLLGGDVKDVVEFG